MTRIKLVLAGLLAMTALATAATAQAARTVAAHGAVYVLTNAASGNAVVAYDRTAEGALVPAGTYATGGNGTGALLGDQGSVIVGKGGHEVFVVNAGSNSISELAVTETGLQLVATVPSGGRTPVSLTLHGKVLYVVNAGGVANVSGFTVSGKGLRAIDGSTQALSVGAAGAAQIQFSPNGRVLAVTEKGSSTIDTFAVDEDGLAGSATTSPSVGGTPFGFDFDARGNLFTSNASGSASSYSIDANGRLQVISGAVAANQAAPCWLTVGNDGRYAYTANGGSGTISRFGIGNDGSLTLLDTPGNPAAFLGAGSHPLDLAISQDGHFLYNLTDGLHRVTAWTIATDGTLDPIGSIGGLPAGAEGIAAA